MFRLRLWRGSRTACICWNAVSPAARHSGSRRIEISVGNGWEARDCERKLLHVPIISSQNEDDLAGQIFDFDQKEFQDSRASSMSSRLLRATLSLFLSGTAWS